jgi:hypothetical protein
MTSHGNVKFPRWVPIVVSEMLNRLLESDSSGPGYLESRSLAERNGERSLYKVFDREVSCLLRLGGVEDERMKGAYVILDRAGVDPDVVRSLVRAAWGAHIDYSKHRNRLERANVLGDEIKALLRQIIGKLTEAGALYQGWPDELYSVHALLSRTDGADPLWRTMRRHVLEGDDRKDDGTFYIWHRTAPSVPECLTTIAGALEGFIAVENGAIGFGINRQQNKKTEFIRGFGVILVELGVEFTPPLLKAMAIAATTVLDDPDIDVSVKDIKQTLTTAGITHLSKKPLS